MKHRVAVYLSLLAVIAGLSAADAQAAPPTPEVEADYAAARAYWQVASPPRCVSVALEMQPTDPKGEGATARATQPTAEMVIPIECHIAVYEDRWANESACMREMVLRHEVGHTLGLSHSEDPASIMAPRISREAWCHEYPPAATSAPVSTPESESVPVAVSEAAEWRAEWVDQRDRCRRIAGHVSQQRSRGCWKWARLMRADYLEVAKRARESSRRGGGSR